MSLTQIKDGGRQMPIFPSLENRGTFTMPTQTIIVVSAIALAFTVFALTLAWADNYTSKDAPPGSKR
jgi:hypothetical protein